MSFGQRIVHLDQLRALPVGTVLVSDSGIHQWFGEEPDEISDLLVHEARAFTVIHSPGPSRHGET